MTPLGLTIVVGISMLLIIIIWIIYIIRTLHKLRNQLSQAFNAINSLLSDDSVKTSEQNQSPMGRLHQYKGYVIKVIQDGGGFKGIIYDNSMKSILAATESLPSQSAVRTAAETIIDFLINSTESKNDD